MSVDSTMPFYEENLRFRICLFCEQNETCTKGEEYPVISHLSRYILQYMSEINAGFTAYPLPGTWEDQPAWFMSLLNAGRTAQSRKERELNERHNAKS